MKSKLLILFTVVLLLSACGSVGNSSDSAKEYWESQDLAVYEDYESRTTQGEDVIIAYHVGDIFAYSGNLAGTAIDVVFDNSGKYLKYQGSWYILADDFADALDVRADIDEQFDMLCDIQAEFPFDNFVRHDEKLNLDIFTVTDDAEEVGFSKDTNSIAYISNGTMEYFVKPCAKVPYPTDLATTVNSVPVIGINDNGVVYAEDLDPDFSVEPKYSEEVDFISTPFNMTQNYHIVYSEDAKNESCAMYCIGDDVYYRNESVQVIVKDGEMFAELGDGVWHKCDTDYSYFLPKFTFNWANASDITEVSGGPTMYTGMYNGKSCTFTVAEFNGVECLESIRTDGGSVRFEWIDEIPYPDMGTLAETPYSFSDLSEPLGNLLDAMPL